LRCINLVVLNGARHETNLAGLLKDLGSACPKFMLLAQGHQPSYPYVDSALQMGKHIKLKSWSAMRMSTRIRRYRVALGGLFKFYLIYILICENFAALYVRTDGVR
jgi:hypothetical protein